MEKLYIIDSIAIWKNLKYFFHLSLILGNNARQPLFLALSLNQLANLLIMVHLVAVYLAIWKKPLIRQIGQFYMYLIKLIKVEYGNVHEWFKSYVSHMKRLPMHPVACCLPTSRIQSRASLVLFIHN